MSSWLGFLVVKVLHSKVEVKSGFSTQCRTHPPHTAGQFAKLSLSGPRAQPKHVKKLKEAKPPVRTAMDIP